MKITGGTNTAIALLEKLQQKGDLVDVYSKSFFDRQPSIKDDPNAAFSKEGFEWLVNEYENDPDTDYKPVGHLLFVYVDDCKEEIKKEIINVYKPLAKLIDAGKHNPDFLIINLFTQQVLCIGLGRKNRLFVIDAVSGANVNAFGLLGGIHPGGLMTGEDHGFMDRFTQHDVYECVSDLIHAVDKLGVSLFAYAGMPVGPDEIQNTLDLGPKENDLYQLEDCGVSINDEGFTKEELIQMLEEANGYLDDIDKSIEGINIFFPECYSGDLNTGDY